MSKDRQRAWCIAFPQSAHLLAALFATLAFPVAVARAAPPVRLADAAEQGAFNVGAARVTASRTSDGADGEVVKLDYALPRGTAAGFWAKAFAEPLSAGSIDVVRLGARTPAPGQPHQVALVVEIKGTSGVQRIPMPLHPDWAFREESVAWQTIGDFREVVVLVSPAGDGEPVEGSLCVDLRFERMPALRKLSTLPAGRIGGVLLVSLVLALLPVLIAASRRRPGLADEAQDVWPEEKQRLGAAWWPGLRQDLARGIGAVFTVGLAVAVYLLAERGRLGAGWAALTVAAGGVALAGWWKYCLTGKHPTAAEAFQDAFASGLLAASVSPLALLQAPTAWSELLLLSPITAATFALLYHAINAYRLATSGRHIGPAGTALLVGSPYTVGGLLLLQTEPLVQALGAGVTGGALAGATAAFVGRAAVLFCFNELVANGLALATKRTLLGSMKGHLALAAAALAAIAAPWVAAAGDAAASGPAAVLAAIVSQAALWAEVYLLTGMLMNALRGRSPTGESVVGSAVEGMKKGAIFSGAFVAILHVLGAATESPLVRWLAETSPLVLAALAGALCFPLLKTIVESFDGSQAFLRRA